VTQPLQGSWESAGKNPLTASFVMVLFCGGLYYAVSSVFVIILAAASALAHERSGGAGFLEGLVHLNERLQVPILSSLVVAQLVFFLALPALLTRRWHTQEVASYYGYRAPRAADLLLAGIGAIAAVPVAVVLSAPLYNLFPGLRELNKATSALMQASTPGRLALVATAIAATPAVCEEALFRGYFLRTLLRRMTPLTAIAVSGLVFALFHRSPLSLPSLFVVGFFLGLVYQRSGSLYPSMLAHLLYNLTFVALVNAGSLGIPLAGDTPLPLGIAAVSTAVFAAAVWALLRSGTRRA
jgi:uncharacterized protein